VRFLVLALLVPSVAAADPLRIPGENAPGDLVEVTEYVDDAVIDMRYATDDNFTHHAIYPKAVCKLRRSVAQRLAKAAKTLRAQKRRLLIWDCYRPTDVQEELWKLVPDEKYVADPKKGSRHSRGAAIDLALVDADGKPVVLPTAFDDFTKAAHRKTALAGKTGVEAKRLEAAMKKAGFVGMPTEWWHFDAPDAGDFPLSNAPL
jgi:D-alanyl-D-alanine dipeptidase